MGLVFESFPGLVALDSVVDKRAKRDAVHHGCYNGVPRGAGPGDESVDPPADQDQLETDLEDQKFQAFEDRRLRIEDQAENVGKLFTAKSSN